MKKALRETPFNQSARWL